MTTNEAAKEYMVRYCAYIAPIWAAFQRGQIGITKRNEILMHYRTKLRAARVQRGLKIHGTAGQYPFHVQDLWDAEDAADREELAAMG